jgi:ribose transport system substrate-binding protein
MGTVRARRITGVVLSAAVALTFAACGSSNDSSSSSGSTAASSSGGGGDSKVSADAQKSYAAAINAPKQVKAVQIGLKPFTPKPGGVIYNISCDVSIVGCNSISNNIKAGVSALGYKYTRCDVGKSPDGPNKCFTNAVNAKPSVIIVNAVGVGVAADGYAAAQKAGIPVVGAFTGDNPGDGGVKVQVAAGGCEEQGKLVADGIAVQSKGDADVLFASEKSIGCDVVRQKGFEEELPKACSACKKKILQFNAATIQQSLPQQFQAELNSNPNLNWIVGVFDGAAAIATTQIQQAGKQDSISVAGMDADPANITTMQKGGPQKLDVAFAFAETPWAAADAAARIYSGQDVPAGVPANIFLVTQDNLDQLPPSKVWDGPTDYKQQFMKLWNK